KPRLEVCSRSVIERLPGRTTGLVDYGRSLSQLRSGWSHWLCLQSCPLAAVILPTIDAGSAAFTLSLESRGRGGYGSPGTWLRHSHHSRNRDGKRPRRRPVRPRPNSFSEAVRPPRKPRICG